jgi:hypothetical protein
MVKKIHAPTKIEHDFLRFMVKSLFLVFESVSIVTVFKILNDVRDTKYTSKFVLSNLNYEMNSFK